MPWLKIEGSLIISISPYIGLHVGLHAQKRLYGLIRANYWAKTAKKSMIAFGNII